MKWKDFIDCPQEVFIGMCLQFPFIFVVGWWVIPIMVVCGIMWRLGGMAGGNKLFRRIGVPLVVCGATFLVLKEWTIFLAVPFMVWANPFSYGENSWLFKFFKKLTGVQQKADYLTRMIGYFWYWLMYALALIF